MRRERPNYGTSLGDVDWHRGAGVGLLPERSAGAPQLERRARRVTPGRGSTSGPASASDAPGSGQRRHAAIQHRPGHPRSVRSATPVPRDNLGATGAVVLDWRALPATTRPPAGPPLLPGVGDGGAPADRCASARHRARSPPARPAAQPTSRNRDGPRDRRRRQQPACFIERRAGLERLRGRSAPAAAARRAQGRQGVQA